MGVGHRHQLHGSPVWQPSPRIERTLWVCGGHVGAADGRGLVALWPADSHESDYLADATVHGYVVSAVVEPCTGTAVEDLVECRKLGCSW